LLGAVGSPYGASTENVVFSSLATLFLADACVGFRVDLLVRSASWGRPGRRNWRSWVGGAWRVRAGTALSYTHLELEVELEAVLAVNRDAPLLAV